jgi:hypothetical protein
MLKTLVTLTVVAMLAESSRAGTVRVDGGTLELNGSLSAANVIVAKGGKLTGSGTIDGSLDLIGTIAPGSSAATVGILTVSQDLICHASSRFVCEVTSHVNGDSLFADTTSGTCTVSVQRADGAIPVDLAIITGSAESDYAGFVMAEALADAWRLTSAGGDLLLTDLTGDSDGDLLSDWWELEHFSGRTHAVAEADSDRDGSDNLNEQTAGTDPGNPTSRFEIVSLDFTSSDRLVTWSSITGRHYRVTRSTNLFETFLPVSGNIAADPPYNTYRDEDDEHAKHYFYRIEIEY